MWADRDVWLPYVDILKMNLEEASSTWLGQSAEVTADPPGLSADELSDLARHCLDRGVGAVCVTLDERGCVAFYRDGSGQVAGKIVDRIATEVSRAVKDPKLAERFAATGVDPLGTTPEEFAAMIAEDIPLWADAVKVAGVQIQK